MNIIDPHLRHLSEYVFLALLTSADLSLDREPFFESIAQSSRKKRDGIAPISEIISHNGASDKVIIYGGAINNLFGPFITSLTLKLIKIKHKTHFFFVFHI